MVNYIIKRMLQGVLLVFCVSVLIFAMLDLMPGDPIDQLVDERVSEERKAEYRVQYGLDKPPVERYITWVKNVTDFEFGISFASKMPVSTMLKSRIPVSLKLCGIAMVINLLISVPLGLLAAYRKDSIFDKTLMSISMFMTAIPSFWIAIMLILFFGVMLKWLPINGFTTSKHFVMPIATIVLSSFASMVRLTKTEVLDVIHEKFVTTAYAKGLSKKVVLVKHVLRNSLILVVVMTFLSLPWLIAGGVITEKVFSIPGMGSLLTNAIISQDFPIVQACILIISILTVISNLAGDIITALLDPRIRESISGGER